MQTEGPDMNPIITREDFRLLKLLERYPALQSELRRATVVSESEVPPDVVTMNSSVAYEDITAHVRDTVKLVYPHAAAGSGHLPVTTPLGMALLGLREGQEVDCNFPRGDHHRLRVEAVLSQPQRRSMTQDEKLDEALKQTFPASDAFVVPWEPRALDVDQEG
jgi:regulator of nucleoside diphosphate kinase